MKYLSFYTIFIVLAINSVSVFAQKDNNHEKKYLYHHTSKMPHYPESVKKEVYRVDLLLPLYLSQVPYKGTVPDKKAIPNSRKFGLDFYQGALIAADSLAKQGFKVELYVHDITETNNTTNDIIQKGDLDSSDLIIGLVQSAELPTISTFAKEHNINFVSALSPSDADVKDNAYFIKIQPDLTTHIEKILDYSASISNINPKFLFFRDSSYSEDALNIVKDYYKKDSHFKTIEYSGDIDMNKYKNDFFTDTTNIIYCTLLDPNHALHFLQSLASLGNDYHFEVYGMPTWKTLPNLTKAGAYPNVTIYYTTPFYYDNTSTQSKNFETANVLYNNGLPKEFTYRGFDLMYWLGGMLYQYGVQFNEYFSHTSNSAFTSYDIEPKWNDDNDFLYLRNTKLYLMKYSNGIETAIQ